MLPPVREIFVVWHPAEGVGRGIAGEIIEHFHSTALTGLIGGAVEVLMRTEAWSAPEVAPHDSIAPYDCGLKVSPFHAALRQPPVLRISKTARLSSTA
jgi:hypothetical protein